MFRPASELRVLLEQCNSTTSLQPSRQIAVKCLLQGHYNKAIVSLELTIIVSQYFVKGLIESYNIKNYERQITTVFTVI